MRLLVGSIVGARLGSGNADRRLYVAAWTGRAALAPSPTIAVVIGLLVAVAVTGSAISIDSWTVVR